MCFISSADRKELIIIKCILSFINSFVTTFFLQRLKLVVCVSRSLLYARMKTNLQALFLLLCCLQLCTAQDDVTILPGNVTIATIFNVNDLENGACGDYDVSDLQSLVAVTWFVEELNRMNYVPGITIGKYIISGKYSLLFIE